MQKIAWKVAMLQKQCLKTKRVLILASGDGSNFEAIVKYFQDKGLLVYDDAKTSLQKHIRCDVADKTSQHKVYIELISDKKDANVLKRAHRLNIKYHYVEFNNLETFLQNNILKKGQGFDLYVLAGFMRVLPKQILDLMEFDKNKIVNIHPSLLPEFKGKNAIERAFAAGVLKTGVTVHFVDENLDGGKILERCAFEVSALSLEELEAKIHALEHKIYPEIIEKLLFKKNVLVFGGGAREHALAFKIALSPYLAKLYLAKPNDGFKNLGKIIEFKDYDELLRRALECGIDILVIGPEAPLFEGLVDMFNAEGIKTIGANKAWARLEESKIFAKEFMANSPDGTIKMADYKIASNILEAKAAFDYFKAKGANVPVIKADGSALGKGVYLPSSYDDALMCAKEYLDGKFGDASRKILIEERLFGIEVSIMSLWDGNTLVSFPPACDYKRLLDDNKGPNTGGMGAYAPSKITPVQQKRIDSYLKKLECALKICGANFCGVVYSGLILTDSSKVFDGCDAANIDADNGVYVLEYNMRFGDPEIQALLELLDDGAGCDLLDIFIKMTQKRLCKSDLKFKNAVAYCLTLASKGYPVCPEKGAEISGLMAAKKHNCKIYFAGVKYKQNTSNSSLDFLNSLATNGGRVMSIVKSADKSNPEACIEAILDIYQTAQKIKYDGKIYRKDIGK